MVFTDKSDKKLKQSYLREHILEAGYDPEDFCEFLEQLKDGGKLGSISLKRCRN